MSRQQYYYDPNGQQQVNSNDYYSSSHTTYQDYGSPASSSGSTSGMSYSSGGSGGYGGGGSSSDSYQCLYAGCNSAFSRPTDLQRHYQTVHPQANQQKIDCQYGWCGRTGDMGFTRKDHYRDHLREVHQVDIKKR